VRPPSLREAQEGLAALLVPWPADGAGARLMPWLVAPARGTLAERLAAHADGYPARVREALADVYPAVEHLVGPARFTALARRYLVAVRPVPRNLNHVGRALADYLVDDALARDLPFLPDLARLEWAVALAFHAHEGTPLDPRALAAAAGSADGVVLRLQPAVAVLASAWPVLDLLRSVDTPRAEIDLPVAGRPQQVLVFRRGLEVHVEVIAPAHGRAVTALAGGTPLGVVAADLAAAGVPPATVTEWFGALVRDGLVVGLTAPPPALSRRRPGRVPARGRGRPGRRRAP